MSAPSVSWALGYLPIGSNIEESLPVLRAPACHTPVGLEACHCSHSPRERVWVEFGSRVEGEVGRARMKSREGAPLVVWGGQRQGTSVFFLKFCVKSLRDPGA